MDWSIPSRDIIRCLDMAQRALRLQFPVVWLGGCEGSLGCLEVEAASHSAAKLQIVEILVGALPRFTVTEGRGVHVKGDSPSTPFLVIH